MAQTNDIMLDDNGALPITTGFFMGDSRGQHLKDILSSAPGEWKQNASVGIAISNYIKSNANMNSLKKLIINQFQSDKFSTNNLRITFSQNTLLATGKTSR